ncbi:MAG TPA: DUF664 domain-containing protein [Dermatophilaceae bacterium]|nr:DUF664 domain-containing protein [Dermatophilaceae bacterium]
MLTAGDFLAFADVALGAMTDTLAELGEELVNARLDVPGSNTPFAVAAHCAGVMTYWGTEVNLGVPVGRDRAAEFRASGTVAEAVALFHAASAALHEAVEAARPLEAAPPGAVASFPGDEEIVGSRATVLLHVYDELCQHLGQLQVTRDVLRAGGAGVVAGPA